MGIMRNDNDLAKNINRLRNLKNWSQQQLADFADVSLQTIFRAESKNIVPRGENLKKIANALGVTESELFSSPNSKKSEHMKNASKDALLVTLFRVLPALNDNQLRAVLALASQFGVSDNRDEEVG